MTDPVSQGASIPSAHLRGRRGRAFAAARGRTSRTGTLGAALGRLASGRERRRVLETFENLLTLLESGVGLEAAWRHLLSPRHGKRRRDILDTLQQAGQEGKALSVSMREFPRHFDPVDVALVRAGEASGDLIGALRRVVARGHLQGKLTSTFLGAIAYPAFLVIFGSVVVVFLTSTVLPNLSAMLVAGGGQVPWVTQVLIGFGRALAVGGLPLPAIAIGVGLFAHHRMPRLKARVARAFLRVPVIGPAYLNWQLAQFCLVLRTLLGSGVFLPDALTLAGDAAGVGPVQLAAAALRGRLLEGHDIADVPTDLARGFPAWLWQALAVGQASGDLEPVLARVGERFEQAALRSASRVAAVLEPAMILFVGLLIGVVAYAALMPIVRLGGLW